VSVKVYVGGLPYSTTSDELQDAARQFAPEATAHVIIDRMTGRSRAWGLVTVADQQSAEHLIEAYDGKDFGGRGLTVKKARPLEPRHPVRAALLEPLAELPVGPAIVQLSEQVSADLIEFFARHPEEMKLMPHRRFEELIAEVWKRLGYEVELTQQTRDHGVDVIAIKHSEVYTRFLIQCKRLSPGKKVTVAPVRELWGVKQHFGGSKAVLATTVYFTRPAQMFIDQHCWELEGRDYDGIVAWLRQATQPQSQDGLA
jgi:HJR/Mrr/RecB family endonuclease